MWGLLQVSVSLAPTLSSSCPWCCKKAFCCALQYKSFTGLCINLCNLLLGGWAACLSHWKPGKKSSCCVCQTYMLCGNRNLNMVSYSITCFVHSMCEKTENTILVQRWKSRKVTMWHVFFQNYTLHKIYSVVFSEKKLCHRVFVWDIYMFLFCLNITT